MTNKKSTKKALLMSALSLLLCCSMLIGTTFAWFTDTVESGVNRITAGNLDVELEHWTGSEWKTVNNATDLFEQGTLWEPGHTEVVYLKLSNLGTLALKYQLGINIVGETPSISVETNKEFKLSDFLYFSVVENVNGETANWDRATAITEAGKVTDGNQKLNVGYADSGVMLAKAEPLYMAVVVYMPETVGNEANYKTGAPIPTIDLGINLIATQITNEYDSFGNDYDAMADGYYHLEYAFSNPADLLAFAPIAGDAASSGLSLTDDGKAQIDAKGAWYTLDVDLTKNEYVMDYDLDITALADGESVVVDTGDNNGWSANNRVTITRGSAKVAINGTEVGTLEGTVLHITHTYSLNADGKWVTTTAVTDGKDTLTGSKTYVAGNPVGDGIYWDVYELSANASKLATIDNFSVKSADAVVDSGVELAAALAEGGKVVLSTDIAATEAIEIPEGVEIELDLNGKTVSGSIAKDAGAILVNNGTLTVVGGTLENNAVNGGAVISNEGTLTIDGATVNGAPMDSTGYPAYAVTTSGKLVVEDGTVISASRGGISTSNGGEVVINGGSVTVSDAADGRNMTLHTIYAYGSDSKLTINGGYFEMGHTSTSGASVICPAGATIAIYGGDFRDAMDDSDWTSTGNFQNYMGYGAPVDVYGGTFDDKTVDKNLADGYTSVDNGDGTYAVLPALDGGATLSVVSGYPHLYTDGTDFYAYDVAGLMSLNSYFANNKMNNSVWTRNYNIMADIDAAGYTWNNVYMITGTPNAEGINLLGNGHTISNLTIAGGGMLGGTPNCTNSTNPAYVKDLTFDNVTVTGNAHFAGIVWGGAAICGDVSFENVHVVNSSVTGNCNVGALIGATGEQSSTYDLTITFKNCSVENTTLVANGNPGADPTGASAFIGRAYANTSLVFEGENVAEGNTITNNNGLVGGGIYGYTIWAGSGFVGTGKCDTFTNWNGIAAVDSSDALTAAVAAGKTNLWLLDGEYNLAGLNGKTVTLSGTKDAVIKVANEGENGHDAGCDGATVTFNGVTIDTTANVGAYRGFTRMNGTYNDCAFVGTYTTSSGVHKFYNCTFDLRNNYVWTWGSHEVLFDHCTFEDGNGVGKAILVHEGAAVTTVTVRDCTFTASTAAYTWDGLYVAAVSIDPAGSSKQITVNFEGTNTVVAADGAAADNNGNIAFAGLHQIKYKSESDQITVKVNGEEVDNNVAADYNPDL